MLTLGMDYERLAQILFKTVLTFNTFSVKVPKKQEQDIWPLMICFILGYLETIYPDFWH